MAIDFLAREEHFADHLIPSYLALPKSKQGTFWVAPGLLARVKRGGVKDAQSVEDAKGEGLTVVASYRDLKLARATGRLVVYSEHGAGQSYEGVRSGSYIGAHDRAGVVAVLVPGDLAANKSLEVHPTIPAYAVGVPKLDHHHRNLRPVRRDPVVAISFHWDCRVCQETRGSYLHYRKALRPLTEEFNLIGHAHPRAMQAVSRHYEAAGIPIVEDFADVIEQADIYCIDNSSTMYEWASLDRPVVVMNAPFYRRDVEHGLRFWSHADVGPQVHTPARLPVAIRQAIEDPPEIAERRREIVRDVYVACDGKAAKRTASVLVELDAQWG